MKVKTSFVTQKPDLIIVHCLGSDNHDGVWGNTMTVMESNECTVQAIRNITNFSRKKFI